MKNKVLTGTYILQTNRAKFNQNEVNPVCQLCKEDDETLQHFLLDCKTLEEARQPILIDFVRVLEELINKYPVSAEYTLIQLLIDSDIVIQTDKSKLHKDIRTLVDTLHYHSRRLTYKLHAVRYNKLQLVPRRTRKRRGAATRI